MKIIDILKKLPDDMEMMDLGVHYTKPGFIKTVKELKEIHKDDKTGYYLLRKEKYEYGMKERVVISYHNSLDSRLTTSMYREKV